MKIISRIGAGTAVVLVASALSTTATAANAKADPVATTTTVAIAPASVAYGAAAEATATVVAASNPTGPGNNKLGGDVQFTINGQIITGKVTGNDGQATVTLPEVLPAGESYAVVAKFVPTDATVYAPSESAAGSFAVVKDNTTTTVKVADVKKGQIIKADVAVASANKQVVNGQVKVTLKRKGKTIKVKTKTLANGAKTLGLGRAKKRGTYKVKVKYLGSTNFNASTVKAKFSSL